MATSTSQADHDLVERVLYALDQFRLGQIDSQRKRFLVDEAFGQYRTTLATTSSALPAGQNHNI